MVNGGPAICCGSGRGVVQRDDKKVRGDRDKVTGKINSACKSLVAVIKSQEVFFWVHDIVSVFI